MKEKITLQTCNHMGYGMGIEFEMASYCTKQFKDPTEIHEKMDCKSCPDFKPYEYEMEYTDNYDCEGIK